MELNVKRLSPDAILPTKAHDSDAGFDLYASVDAFVAGSPVKIKTDIAMEIPLGYFGMICNRSSLGSQGLQVYGGICDNAYRGEILIMLATNHGGWYTIKKGDKIAQMVILPVPQVEVIEVEELGESERGNKGFGSSGR